MKRLSFNQINSLKGAALTPTQRMFSSKVRLSKPSAIRKGPEPNNNDPCPCGSGMKYKHCCKG
jgi:uncharacterized protein YecA (UPF0149 family)